MHTTHKANGTAKVMDLTLFSPFFLQFCMLLCLLCVLLVLNAHTPHHTQVIIDMTREKIVFPFLYYYFL